MLRIEIIVRDTSPKKTTPGVQNQRFVSSPIANESNVDAAGSVSHDRQVMQENTALSAISSGKSSSLAVDPRHEARLHIAVPVKVCPDLRATDWHSCCTYEISLHGARLATLPGITQVGQVIWVQRQNRRAKFKVAWIGEAGTSQSGQIGVESTEPGNVIWESEIRVRMKNSR